MPFGLAVAPNLWKKVRRPVLADLRRTGFLVIAYVDVFGGEAPTHSKYGATKAEAVAGDMLRRLLASHGLTFHRKKRVWDGTTCLPLLGFLVGTRRRMLSLQPSRTREIIGMADQLLVEAKTHSLLVRHSALRSFTSATAYTHLAVPLSHFYLISLYAAMRDDEYRGRGSVRIGPQAMKDLALWQNLTPLSEIGRPPWQRPPDATMTKKASSYGWGATWDGTVPARGFQDAPCSHLHINLLQVGAVRLGLLSFADFLKQTQMVALLCTDSRVTMGVMNAGSYRSFALMSELRRRQNICLSMRVTLRAEHVPSALIFWADRLSRTSDSTDWTLWRSTFLKLEAHHRPYTIDVLATAENKQCGRFLSKFLSAGGTGVDAMKFY